MLSDNLYDSRGIAVQTNGPYSDRGTPGTALVGVADAAVPRMTTSNAAERATESVTMAVDRVATEPMTLGAELFRTSTRYFGDHAEVTATTPGSRRPGRGHGDHTRVTATTPRPCCPDGPAHRCDHLGS